MNITARRFLEEVAAGFPAERPYDLGDEDASRHLQNNSLANEYLVIKLQPKPFG